MIDPSARIHATALVSEAADIGPGADVGAYTIIGEGVSIGAATVVGSHCVIRGPTVIGSSCRIFQFCSIGEACQDLKYQGEPTTLVIGDCNTIREHCTLHRGTVQGRSETTVGSHNLLMVNTHVAHDCVIGDHCIFANNATLAGHVTIGDYVIFGGNSAIHQYGRVGAHAFIAGMCGVNKDIPPYVMAAGPFVKAYGINKVGLVRRGFTREAIRAIRSAYMTVYHRHLTLEQAVPAVEELAAAHPEVRIFADFIKEHGRGIAR